MLHMMLLNYCHSGTLTNLFPYDGRICNQSFGIQNGTRQGSVLSPFLFTLYIREVLSGIINSNIGRNIGGYMVNILAYADDLVLLAPSWRALQQVSNCLINCKLQLVTLICAATARKLSV